MMTRSILLLVGLLIFPSSALNHRRIQRKRIGGGRLLGPIQDIFLGTIDIITRPDDGTDEGGVDENSSSTAPTATATTIVPTTAPVISVLSPLSSAVPSFVASNVPSDIGSVVPSDVSMEASSNVPSSIQSDVPSTAPSDLPSTAPSDQPTLAPSTTNPSDVPTMIPSDSPSLSPTTLPTVEPTFGPSDIPSLMPTSIPSEIPTTMPSNLPSTMPSTVPSDAPSHFPSNTPSSILSSVPSSVPSITISSSPTVSKSSSTKFSQEDIAVFESICTQFLYDYLPLVQPNTYSDLSCTVVNQTATNASLRRRQLQDNDAAVVPFRVKDVEMLVAVNGEAPGETNFAQVVTQTFETFGTELQDSLSKTSTAFSDGKNNHVEKPVVPTGETTNVTSESTNGPTLDWAILGSAMAGGVCLALIVSLLLVKSRNRRHIDTTDQPETNNIEDTKSKSFSVSSVRDASSYREYSLIKLVSIEASRSLQKNEEEEDCMVIPPTPLGIDTVPGSLLNSPEEIKSELSPASSYLGEMGCCQNALNRFDTFEGPGSMVLNQNADTNPSVAQDDFDRNSTYMTGISSTAMMTNETATKLDHLSSSQSESSDLEGLRLVVSNTNTFSNAGSKVEAEPPAAFQKAEVEEKRGFFSFRPSLFSKRRSAMKSTAANPNDSIEVEEDCCAADNWTVRTNSILTPRKANTTTGNTSIKGQSGSF